MSVRSRFVPLLALPVLLLAAPAHATYSIVATDQATRQVGGAVTSCVSPSSVSVVYGSAPGFGAIHAQALENVAGRNQGVTLLRMGTAPMQIIQQITSPQFDPNASMRQYGVVDLQGRAAGFTGTDDGLENGDKQGNVGTFAYSVQGNILTSRVVLDQAEAAFRTTGCDLPDKLMLALEAGARNGNGDMRCKPAPSDSAFIEVDLEGATAGSYLRLSVVEQAMTNPLPRLRTMFDAWRATHPCGGPDGGVIVDSGAPRDAASDASVRVDAGDARPVVDAGRDASSSGGNGGAGGAGGSVGSGGSAGSGGDTGAGGTTGSGGGSAGSAGAVGSTTGSSGATGVTGTTGGSGTGSATGGSGGATTGSGQSTGPAGESDSGCSCHLSKSDDRISVVALVGFAAMAAAFRRRRQS